MHTELTLFSIIILVGAAHGLFLALTLINSRGAQHAGRIFLAMLTLAFATDLAHEFLFQSEYLVSLPLLRYVDPIINLFYGPFFYLYVRALTQRESFKLNFTQCLHFLPVIVAIVICSTLPTLNDEQFHRLFYQGDPVIVADEITVMATMGRIALSSALSIGIYLFLSIRRLVIHARKIRQEFSSIEKVTLNWLRYLLVALSTLYAILIFDGFFSQDLGLNDNINHLLYLLVVVVIYAMGYMGMRQPAIFSPSEYVTRVSSEETAVEKSTVDSDTVSSGSEKYKSSALDAESSAALCSELKQHMQEQKPYLEAQLTLPQLATQIQISSNYLSQVINEQVQLNFFDFVNGYRVNEAKTLLLERRNLSVLDIAYQSGFNSKSAFYTAFKKHVGMTPSEFKKQQNDK